MGEQGGAVHPMALDLGGVGVGGDAALVAVDLGDDVVGGGAAEEVGAQIEAGAGTDFLGDVEVDETDVLRHADTTGGEPVDGLGGVTHDDARAMALEPREEGGGFEVIEQQGRNALRGFLLLLVNMKSGGPFEADTCFGTAAQKQADALPPAAVEVFEAVEQQLVVVGAHGVEERLAEGVEHAHGGEAIPGELGPILGGLKRHDDHPLDVARTQDGVDSTQRQRTRPDVEHLDVVAEGFGAGGGPVEHGAVEAGPAGVGGLDGVEDGEGAAVVISQAATHGGHDQPDGGIGVVARATGGGEHTLASGGADFFGVTQGLGNGAHGEAQVGGQLANRGARGHVGEKRARRRGGNRKPGRRQAVNELFIFAGIESTGERRRVGAGDPDMVKVRSRITPTPYPPRPMFTPAWIRNSSAGALASLVWLPLVAAQVEDRGEVIGLAAFSVSAERVTGYRAGNAITATGVDTAIIDTPIAINVVTGEFLSDTAAFELRHALDFVPGVRTAENNESRFRVRGFTSLAALRNGHFRRQLFPTWNIDRVEVIKGATAIFHGSSRPGGIINYVTRRPSFTAAGEVRAMYGSHDHVRGEVHYTGPLSETLAFRVGAGAYTAGGFRDDWSNEGNYFGTSGTWRPSDRVELTLDFEYIDQDISDQQSTDLFTTNDQRSLARIYPAEDPTGYRFNLGGPESFRLYSSLAVDLDLRVAVTDRITYRLEGNFAEDNFEVLRSQGIRENAGANAGTVTIRFGNFANYRDSWDVKNTLVGEFETGAMEHTLMLGHQSNEMRQRTPGFGRKNGRQGPQFRYRPATGQFPEFPALAAQYPLRATELIEGIGGRTGDGPWNDNRRVRESATAFYLIDTITMLEGRLRVMAGARYNELRETLAWDSRPVVAPADRLVQDRVTPQAGLLYKVTDEWSVFASYSESLESQNSIDADGNVSGPIEGRGYEFGIKADAFENRLSATISLFEVERANTASRDTLREALEGRDPLFFFGNTDTSQGVELDLAYNPLAQWQVLVSYAWLWQREVTGAQDPTRIGTIFEQTPEHALNVWTKYTFASGALKGGEIGGGVRWDDGYLVTPLIKSNASHRFDLLLRYPLEIAGRTVTAMLNVNNVTDERNLGGSINWTNPREFTLSLSTRF